MKHWRKLAFLVFLAALVTSQGASQVVNGTELDNITLTMSFNSSSQTYVDGNVTTTSVSTESFENGYIVSGQPAGLIGLSGPQKLVYREEGSSSLLLGGWKTDEYSLVQDGGSFLAPFTRGGLRSVESEIDSVGSGFLNRLSPSFGFPEADSRSAKVIYEFPYNVTSFRQERGLQTLHVRNRFVSGDTPELEVVIR